MIYTVVTSEYGRVEDVKSFRNSDEANDYFKVQNEWALNRFGMPDEKNGEELESFNDFGEAELIFAKSDCRVFITSHGLI